MYVKVKAVPGAKRETVERMDDTTFKISVKEPARHNAANRRICALVAREFGVSAGAVRIINGHRHRSKLLEIKRDE